MEIPLIFLIFPFKLFRSAAGRLEQAAQFIAEEEVDHHGVAFHVPGIGVGDGVLNTSKGPVAGVDGIPQGFREFVEGVGFEGLRVPASDQRERRLRATRAKDTQKLEDVRDGNGVVPVDVLRTGAAGRPVA